jgi:hypothetical protein
MTEARPGTTHRNKETSIVVSHLDNHTTKNDVCALFAQCGHIVDVHLRRSNHGDNRLVLQFRDVQSVEQALLLDGTELGGSFVRVERAWRRHHHYRERRHPNNATESRHNAPIIPALTTDMGSAGALFPLLPGLTDVRNTQTLTSLAAIATLLQYNQLAPWQQQLLEQCIALMGLSVSPPQQQPGLTLPAIPQLPQLSPLPSLPIIWS